MERVSSASSTSPGKNVITVWNNSMDGGWSTSKRMDEDECYYFTVNKLLCIIVCNKDLGLN